MNPDTPSRPGMEKGYIKLWRKFRDNPLWKEKRTFSRAEAFLDLLLSANGTDKTIIFDGKPLLIKRGQLVTSQRELAARWGWAKTKTRDFIFYLQNSDHAIKVNSDRKKTLITIMNYPIYNPLKKPEKTTKTHEEKTTQRPLKDHRQATTNKDIKKEKEEERSSGSDVPEEICGLMEDFANLLLDNDDESEIPETDQEFDEWAKEFTLLIKDKEGGRSIDQVRKVMYWCQRDSFWRKTILTPEKFRKNYPALRAGWKESEKAKPEKGEADQEEFLRRQKEARK
jgi:hypothetical protein